MNYYIIVPQNGVEDTYPVNDIGEHLRELIKEEKEHESLRTMIAYMGEDEGVLNDIPHADQPLDEIDLSKLDEESILRIMQVYTTRLIYSGLYGVLLVGDGELYEYIIKMAAGDIIDEYELYDRPYSDEDLSILREKTKEVAYEFIRYLPKVINVNMDEFNQVYESYDFSK